MDINKLKPPINPAQFELGPVIAPRPLLYAYFNFQRYLDTWLEHERVVVASPVGMRVLI
jgi:hypothetical protein